jgi:exosortase/archaeosortase family protein
MKIPKIKLPEKLEPLKGVILFAVILMASNFFWKLNVLGDEASNFDSNVTFWGLDISAPFIWMAHHVSTVTYSILHFLNQGIQLKPINTLNYPNGNSVHIIWACTGIKQAYICFCILAFARGSWQKKLWYIPISLLVVYIFNIFRITFIVGCIQFHPNWFEVLHLYIFKYSFYAVIFLMWVLWEEKISNKSTVSTPTANPPEK